MLSFLFLTYGDINNIEIWEEFFKNSSYNYNIYVHCKYKTKVKSFIKNYIIDDIINTKWGDISIVDATIKMLKESIKNINNKYFILCSESCIPLYKFDDIVKYLENNKIKSYFKLYDKINKDDIIIYKTSQWWILCKKDIKIILKGYKKYRELLLKIDIRGISAYDEIFFLTLLKNEVKNYKYNDIETTYVKWFTNYISKHPLIYNYIMSEDIKECINRKSIFIRKCNKNMIRKIIDINRLIIIYIGEYTNKNFINKINNLLNNKTYLMILTYNDDYKIEEILLKKTIYIWNTRGTTNDIYKYFMGDGREFLKNRFKNVIMYDDENNKRFRII